MSDTFASALWALDTMFNMDRAGVDGVNIHTFARAFYEPFAVHDRGGVWIGEVRPMYYGLLMFAWAAPPGSRLLPATYGGPRTLRIWSTRGLGKRLRVVLINDSRRRPATVAVRSPIPASSATGIRLRAPGAGARSGVTIGGQAVRTPTRSGALAGAVRTFILRPVGRSFVVRLPSATATLLTIDPR